MSPLKRQSGLSLVELMIAMVIGLIVLAGLAQILLSGKRSYGTQSGLGTMQENARFALYFLQRDIAKAGFPRSAGPSISQPTMTPFVAANTLDGTGGASDQIEIRFNSDPDVEFSFRDCLGQTSQTVFTGGCADGSNSGAENGDNCSWQVTNRYDVLNGALRCTGSGNPNAPQPLLTGVENMQILYGEDLDDDTYADVYRNASQVGDWNRVTAVRIALLINTQEVIADERDNREYALLDAAPISPVNDAATAADEARMRRNVFTTTIEVRNRTR